MAEGTNRYATRLAEQQQQPKQNRYAARLAGSTGTAPELKGNLAGDLWASFAGGANALLKTGGDLYGVATGDYENFASQQGQSGLDYWQKRKSPKLLQMEEQRKAKIDSRETEFGKAATALWETVSNPGLMASFVFEQAPMLLPIGGIGRAGKALTVGMGYGEKAAARAATGAAVGTGAAMQGADAGSQAYEQLMALPDAVWMENDEVAGRVQGGESFESVKQQKAASLSRDSAIASGIASVGLSLLPGARTLEKALAGVKLPKGRLASIIQGFGGESVSEGIEEGSAALFANLATKKIDPTTDAMKGVGEQFGMGAAAGVFGGLGGAVAPLKSMDAIAEDLNKVADPNLTIDESIRAAMDLAQSKAVNTVDFSPGNTIGGTFKGTRMDASGQFDPFGFTPAAEPEPETGLEIPVVEDTEEARAMKIADAEQRVQRSLVARDQLLASDDATAMPTTDLQGKPIKSAYSQTLAAVEQEVTDAQSDLDALRALPPVAPEAGPIETVPFVPPKTSEANDAIVARRAEQEKQKAADFDKAIQQRAEQETSWAKSDSEFYDRLAKYNDKNSPINPAMQNAMKAAFLNKPENKGKDPEDVQPSPPLETPTAATIADYDDALVRKGPVKISKLSLSKDVPQFKSDADEKGIVEPLTGKFMKTAAAPILVWERLNGKLEVISGRHRYDLAKRSGEKEIDAHVVKEADGFNKRQAQMADAELNIRDEQGSVSDYANYFRGSGISAETAESRGLLGRFKGRAGFSLATKATPTLFHNFQRRKLTDAQAAAIADTAPNDERLQTLGIKQIQSGSTIEVTVGTMQAVQAIGTANPELSAQGDIFGFDDSAMREAERIGKQAAARKKEISEQINSVAGAARRPEKAKELGVNVKDPKAVKKKLKDLQAQAAAWENWPTNPELRAELLKDLAITLPEPKAAPEAKADVTPQVVEKVKEKVVDEVPIVPEPEPVVEEEINEDQEDMFAAPEPAPVAKPVAEGKPLSEIKIAHEFDDGENQVTVSLPADQLLSMIDTRIEAAQKLLTCLKGK